MNTQRSSSEDAMSTTSDFVKKLYKMLEDQTFQHVVSWGPHGDCFIVKDMNEFTKSILPRMFKHSNFASFVRQLNKYDFHKVKNSDDNQFGEQSWTFRHPDFHAHRRDALENIKRKVPTSRKPNTANVVPSSTSATTTRPLASNSGGLSFGDSMDYRSGSGSSGGDQLERTHSELSRLTSQNERLNAQHEESNAYIRSLESNVRALEGNIQTLEGNVRSLEGNVRAVERNYHDVLVELVGFQKTMAQQDGVLQGLIGFVMGMKGDKDQSQMNLSSKLSLALPSVPPIASTSGLASGSAGMGDSLNTDATFNISSPFLPLSVAREEQATAFNQDYSAGSSLQGALGSNARAMQAEIKQPSFPFLNKGKEREAEEVVMPSVGEQTRDSNSSSSISAPPQSSSRDTWVFPNDNFLTPPPRPSSGMQVYLMPRNGWGGGFDESAVGGQEQISPPSSSLLPPSSSNLTSTGTWSTPPHILLVDDDAVSRKLSSKFLQVFGCAIDVAVDGVGAVDKMNSAMGMGGYDLVLMDIVMPKLDGVSATSIIRKFDHMTPIISMTSNAKPSEVLEYFSHGMNDILSKPFTKQGLLDMLEKHLIHLKVMKQMQLNNQMNLGMDSQNQIVSSNGPPSYPGTLEWDDRRTNNSLTGMGLSDVGYGVILAGLSSSPSLGSYGLGMKRDRESEEEREGKRGRFEVVE